MRLKTHSPVESSLELKRGHENNIFGQLIKVVYDFKLVAIYECNSYI